MKTFNWIFISLISVTMIFGGTAMAQSNRGRRGGDDCTVPNRGTRADRNSDWERNRNRTYRDYGRNSNLPRGMYTNRGNRGYRNPYAGTYYKNRRRLPNRALTVRHRGNRLYYLDGLFYQEMRRGFMVVNPPIGLVINRRPFDSERVRYRGRVYFHSGPYWFMKRREGSGFVLVRNPFR